MSRIYETDSYLRELKTVITASGTDDKGRPYVELADTIFFPEEGGQNADRGWLTAYDPKGERTVSILNGVITGRNTCSAVSDSDEIRIRYIVSEPVTAGTEVLCKLDWEARFDRMQNHSGEHVLSGIVHRRFGAVNVGFHLSDTGPVTVDFDRVISYEDIISVQNEANRVIYANMPVTVSFPSSEELKSIDYRSKIDIEGQVRLITISSKEETVDICACCAPHVDRTGEIGLIKVLSAVNWKGGIRISMLAGRRALEYINKEHELLTGLARSMSTEAVNVPGMVDSYRNEIVSLKSELAGLKERLLIERVYEMKDKGDAAHVIFASGDTPAPVMKNVYNALTESFDGFVGIFAGDDMNGYRYNAGSRDKDSRDLASGLRENFGAKGGGSFDMIQGKVSATREDITGLFANLEKGR